ncbi:lateral flagellar motor switch protein LfiM [Aeromonas finlandensis]|uniref:lateral flagellar motor switch protein LfiM n=1 Tax=Aeromonas finlandensis TaxID=1543375 RepID=UPI001427D92C|nr:lateral flagellar motor switch protein LfiM [Aeromonas finlandensis]
MSSSSAMLTPSRLLNAERGRTLPHYDLLGCDRVNQARLKQVNSQLSTFFQQAASCMAQLFNSADCELNYGEFASSSLAEVAESHIWVEARSPLEPQGAVYFSIAPLVIYRLAVLFFGGTLQQKEDPVQSGKGLSDTEQRLLLRLCQYQVDIWSASLGLGDLKWQLHVVPQDSLAAGQLWTTVATLQAGHCTHQWQMWLLPPEESISPVIHSLPAGQLEQVLAHIPVRLRVVMGQLPMTLADLECLQVGDVLSLDLPEVVPALVGSRPCFSGRIAEHKGSLVYQVATVVEE